jgi:hypothetical protein
LPVKEAIGYSLLLLILCAFVLFAVQKTLDFKHDGEWGYFAGGLLGTLVFFSVLVTTVKIGFDHKND